MFANDTKCFKHIIISPTDTMFLQQGLNSIHSGIQITAYIVTLQKVAIALKFTFRSPIEDEILLSHKLFKKLAACIICLNINVPIIAYAHHRL